MFGTITYERDIPERNIDSINVGELYEEGNVEDRGMRQRNTDVRMLFMKKSLLGVADGYMVIQT